MLWLAAGAGAQATQPRGEDFIAALSDTRGPACASQAAGAAARLRPLEQLSEAAGRIARGEAPGDAARRTGYRATRLFVASMSGYGTLQAVARTMGQKHCNALGDSELRDLGIHRRGDAFWIVLAAPFAPPPPAAAPAVAARVLSLTNQARSKARTCGTRSFAPAEALAPSPLLDRAAAAHARDMARHGNFEHEGSDGSGPADRITQAGYRWRSVGENIASGQTTAEQVVREWIGSPVHCANLMSPRFTEMGVAYAVDLNSAQGIYWAQVFGRPR